jgi:hypothetical protein
MRDQFKPGDLAIRLGFGRVYGSGPDRGQVKPHIEIADQTSGKILTIDLTADDLVEMLSGGAAMVPADRVSGFRGVATWGRYLKTITRKVKTEGDDYKLRDGDLRKAAQLPHVAKVIAEIEADGYACDTPRRDNTMHWVLIGRKYDVQP